MIHNDVLFGNNKQNSCTFIKCFKGLLRYPDLADLPFYTGIWPSQNPRECEWVWFDCFLDDAELLPVLSVLCCHSVSACVRVLRQLFRECKCSAVAQIDNSCCFFI